MIGTTKLLTAFAIGLIILAGCAEEVTEPPTETTPDDDDTPLNPIVQRLPGSWSTGCLEKPSQFAVGNTYLRESLTFSSTQISINYGEFTEASCRIVAISNPGTIRTGNWSLGEEVQTEDGLTAYEFDYLVSEAGGSQRQVRTILHLDSNTVYLGNPTQDSSRPSSLALTVPYYRQ